MDTVPWNGTGGRTRERTGQGHPCSSPARGHQPGLAGEEQGATGGSLCCWWKRQGRGSIMPLARIPGIPPVGWGKKETVREPRWGTEPLSPSAPHQAAHEAAGLRGRGTWEEAGSGLCSGQRWPPARWALAACALHGALHPPTTPSPHLRGLLVVLPLWLQQRFDQWLLNSLLSHLLWLGVNRGVSPTHTAPHVAPTLRAPTRLGGPSRDQQRTQDTGVSTWGAPVGPSGHPRHTPASLARR